MMNVMFTPRAWQHYTYFLTEERDYISRLQRLIKEICREPFEGTGRPKPLRDAEGAWSRRLDHRHRIVYVVHDDVIEFQSLRGHYWYDK